MGNVEHELMPDGGRRLPLEGSAGWGLLDAAVTMGAAVLKAADAGSNAVCSPLSLLMALCMLRTGAGGGTAKELDAKLGLPADSGVAAVGLLAELSEFDHTLPAGPEGTPPKRPLVHLASALVFGEGVDPGDTFRAKLGEYFGAEVLTMDSRRPDEGRAVLDAWVRRHTAGEVRRVPGQPPGKLGLSLLNTVFFAASWKKPFEEEDTTARRFKLHGGSTVKVPTMRGWLNARYVAQGDWEAVELPYSEGFAMQLVLPKPGRHLGVGVQAAAWNALADAPYRAVEVRLPRWSHDAELDLLPVLGSLGLERTLGPRPDFEAIAPDARISAVKQAVMIRVAEAGTEAAAVTRVEMLARGIPDPAKPKRLDFNRPFLYQVVHQETGVPLFMGRVEDPR